MNRGRSLIRLLPFPTERLFVGKRVPSRQRLGQDVAKTAGKLHCIHGSYRPVGSGWAK